MKCPNCRQNPMTFFQFALQMIPIKTICGNCQTRLKGDMILRAAYYAALILAVFFGLRIVALKESMNWELSAVIFSIAAFVVVTILISAGFAWKFGRYVKDE